MNNILNRSEGRHNEEGRRGKKKLGRKKEGGGGLWGKEDQALSPPRGFEPSSDGARGIKRSKRKIEYTGLGECLQRSLVPNHVRVVGQGKR